MKMSIRILVAIAVLFSIQGQMLRAENAVPVYSDMTAVFSQLWNDSNFGNDSNKRVQVVWVIRNAEGYAVWKWPVSNTPNGFLHEVHNNLSLHVNAR